MVAGSAGSGPGARWPLVARTDELALFRTLLADPTRRGILLGGPAGVGKTRLAEEFLDLARTGAGRAGGRATGTATAANLPLGALAHLMPAEVATAGPGPLDPVALFTAVAGWFRRLGHGRPYVLLADDLHLLDTTSLTVLAQLVDAGAVFLIGTVRTGEPVPDIVSTLWRGERLVRCELAELSRDGVEALLTRVLGGPVESGTVADLHAKARGNVLFVRELVLGAVAAGRLVAAQGVWRLTGPLVSTPPLADLVEAQVGSVDAPARRVLDLLALVCTAGLAELSGIADAAALEALERSGHVTVHADRRRHEVELAHPVYGEVLRARLPLLTRRRLLLEHADRVSALGARRRGDLLRVATWRLDATGTADPDLLLTAARLARYGHDFTQVRRLTRAALAERTTVEARLLLGEALYELGEFAEAERVLLAATDQIRDEGGRDRELVLVAATRARNLAWGLLEPALAVTVCAAARDRITDPVGRDELLAVEARVMVHRGLLGPAQDRLAALRDATDLRIRVLRAVPEATALVLSGRCAQGLAVARQAMADHLVLGDQYAMVHPGTHQVLEVFALAEAGRLAEAVERATTGRDLAVRDRSTIGRVWFAYHLGRCALLGGQVRTAMRWYAEARALCRDHGYPWPQRLVTLALAHAAAVAGDCDAARLAIADADAHGDLGYLEPEQRLAPAWLLAADGDLAGARALLTRTAATAAQAGHHGAEAWLRHDLARLGAAADVRNRLAELAGFCESDLVAAYARHAAALADRDPACLSAVAGEFERLGALLYAAEAAHAAAEEYQRAGRGRVAAGQRTRATALAAHCEQARTPGLLGAAGTVPLTRRERQVAVLAAGGASSKDIAARLHLSSRTVDNHLQNVYAKLGVTRRGDLAAALLTAAG